MANILINSLKRLYASGRITKEQVSERVGRGIITNLDYLEITGEEYEDQEG